MSCVRDLKSEEEPKKNRKGGCEGRRETSQKSELHKNFQGNADSRAVAEALCAPSFSELHCFELKRMIYNEDEESFSKSSLTGEIEAAS